MENRYDIIVAGGGHAGIEASYASAKMGMRTALITLDINAAGRPSCNPSIGGTAKGHLVKEIDALGGAMGFLADRAGILFKMLNQSKGPAVWSPRCQIDKDLYPKYAYELLIKTKNLYIINDKVKEILIRKGKVSGVITEKNESLYSKAVILCAGTFLNGIMYTGCDTAKGGRFGEDRSEGLSDKLKDFGFEISRLKTGTPPRIYSHSIDFSKTEPSLGDEIPSPFSYNTSKVKNRIICYSTATNKLTHEILSDAFDRSPMFTGTIKGTGPRYCPSIEDKVARFAGRDMHKVMLEPEGLNTKSVYMNGFSSSMPKDVQEKAVRTVPGLENAEIMRYAYAIEYDYFIPYQLNYTLETKTIQGLYFAGQINGTSGYEEAAAQGIIAGINAALKIKSEEPFILRRNEAYIGVLIDDLVNKSIDEPYRLFTSLAEYRLLLRQDNADYRLMYYGNKFGLVPDEVFEEVQKRKNTVAEAYEKTKKVRLPADDVNIYLKLIDESPVKDASDLHSLTKRAKVKLKDLLLLSNGESDYFRKLLRNEKILHQVQTEIKYEGYIKRQLREVEYFMDNEMKRIPDNFDYGRLTSLSNEAREKLIKIQPRSLGQASRISGVSAADVSIISIFLK